MELGLGLAVFTLILPFLPAITESVRFELESGHVKCVGEDVKNNSMTVGSYSVINPNEGHSMPPHHKITVRVFSVNGNQLHKADEVESGQFTFYAEEDGSHMACLSAVDHQPPVNISVEFGWRSGVLAKDWSNVVKKGSLDGMQVELKKMEDIATSILDEMLYLRWREYNLQLQIRNTNSKMGWFSLFSLFLCLSVAGLQIWHLKSFFEKKKII